MHIFPNPVTFVVVYHAPKLVTELRTLAADDAVLCHSRSYLICSFLQPKVVTELRTAVADDAIPVLSK